jgi:hypothetical protein
MATPALSIAYACTTCKILEYSSPAPLMAARRIGMLKNRSSTTIWVPCVPAHALGSAASPGLAGTITPSAYVARYAHGAPAVIEVMETCATCEIDASASPRKPKVSICSRSSYSRSLEVANRSHTRGKSAWAIPCPSSLICSSFIPPARDSTLIEVEPASSEFSSISLSALAGRWITSPAAIRFTTSLDSARMGVGWDAMGVGRSRARWLNLEGCCFTAAFGRRRCRSQARHLGSRHRRFPFDIHVRQ